jgi:hypothetical protein
MVVLVVLVVVVGKQMLVLLALLGRQQTIPDQHNKVILLEHLDQDQTHTLLVEVVVLEK